MDNSAVIAPASAGGAALVRFDNSRGELIWLLIKNFLLNLVTLGIYRFWARTNIRRYFWRSIEIGGERLEYVGRGIELFIGFLIVVAVIFLAAIPLYVVEFLLLGAGLVFVIVVNLAYYSVLLVLIQIAIFRARRYRTSRTVWRGIRFGLEGKSLRYAGISCLYGLLVLVTLGFAVPWRNVALQRYIMDGTRFGQQHFQFDGDGRDLFPIWSIVILVGYTVVALIVVVNLQFVIGIFEFAVAPPESVAQTAAAYALVEGINPNGWWPFLLLPIYFVVRIWYGVRQFTYFVNRTTCGETSFASSLRTPQVIWYLVTFGVLVFLGLAATVAIFTTMIIVSTVDVASGQMLSVLLLISLVLMAFVLFALLNVLRIAWLYFELLRIGCRSISIGNFAAIDNVVRGTDDTMKFGEGLADALDYGDI